MSITWSVAVCAALCLAGTASAQEHTLIVLSHSNFTVYQVDVKTNRVINQFKAKDEPHEAAITPDMRTLFAAVPEGPHVVILDAETLQQKGIIESEHFRRRAPAGNPPRDSAAPHGIAVNNDGTKLYVGLERGEVPGLVVYDIKAGKVLKKVDLLLNGGHYMAMQPATDKLYYPHREDNRVVVFDTKSDRVTKIIPVAGGPTGVDFAPNGEVWLHQDLDGSVAVVDSKTDEVTKVIKTTGQGAGRIAVSPDGKFAASTHRNSGDVAIIDTARKEIVANVTLGAPPYLGYPLFSPDSKTLYILEFQGGNLAALDLASMQVTSRVKMGSDPFGGVVRRATTMRPRSPH
jgi:YVTN family beta-propeller protein